MKKKRRRRIRKKEKEEGEEAGREEEDEEERQKEKEGVMGVMRLRFMAELHPGFFSSLSLSSSHSRVKK